MSTRIATAEWADPALVEEKYLYRDGTVWLGRSASEQQVPIGYVDDRHVCVVSGSRGGKGTTSIVNNLILWPGSVCVVDAKGENATVTAARRGRGSQHCKGLGQSVKVLDPFKAAQVDDSLRGRFNPLDALDPASEETIDEAGRIADAVVVIHESNDPFWDESARAMVKGLILHVLTAPEYEGRRNLVTVRKLITRGDWESVGALRDAGEKDIPSAHGMLWTGLANNPAFDGLIAGIGDSFTNMLLNSPKQFESVLQVANRNTEFIDSPPMQRCIEASDFQLSELKTRPEGLSVYLCLPQRFMSTHYRWLRMMIALTVTEMEKVRGQPATGYPALMVLDEFAGLKRMEVIENAVAQIAGYGMKLYFVLQSLEQLKAVYKDNWETFLANSGLKVFFNLEDNFSREYVSKLIGETEVMREVRSESDSTSESESLSRSTSRSQSESRGRSSSTGTSENEGTNSSVSTGKSWGANWGESRSQNYSYAQGWIFRNYDNQRIGDSRSQSSGRSVTESKGQSHGVSHGTSRSRTDGTSDTVGTSTSETDGTTHGTSQSRTAGMSETVHKRSLVTPDEIGQVFSRVDDRADRAYPGLALVVISGARPVPLRRVNYYEDFQFMGLFDPHPDHPFIGPKILTVETSAMGKNLMYFGESGLNLRMGEWSVTAGQMVAAGDPLAVVLLGNGTPAGPRIRAPRAGMIAAVHNRNPVPAGPLFSIRYFEDDALMMDPFAEMAVWRQQMKDGMTKQRDDLRKSVEKIAWVMGGAILLGAIFGAVVWGDGAAAIIAFVGLGALLALVIPKSKKAMAYDASIKKYFSEPGASFQATRQVPALTAAPAGVGISSPADTTTEAALDRAEVQPQTSGEGSQPAFQPPLLTAASSGIGISSITETRQEQTPAALPPSAPERVLEKRTRTATVPIVLAGVLAIAAIAFIGNAIYKSEKAAAAQRAAEQAAKDAAEKAAHDGMMTSLFNKYGVRPKTPQNAGTNATDPQKGSDASTAAPAPSKPPVPGSTAPSPQNTVPPIDPNDDPVGSGGFITPHETETVQKEVQVCVPLNLLDHQWNSPPPGGKMEAFKGATRNMIRDKARSIRVDENTQFRVNDLFDGFDPARTDPRFLVTVLHPASGAATCPADSHRYTLTVDTNP
jgi:type IV secretory pathway TraG/TraD family ATPase VirD4